jgi:transposase
MSQDTDLASRLLGLEGVAVAEIDAEADGGVTVWVITSDERAALCPGCQAPAGVKEQVITAPADVEHGGRRMRVVWVKHRRLCSVRACPVKTFTESLPQIPPRCRLTTRLREQAAGLVAEEGMTVGRAAQRAGLSWPTVHEAFAAAVDPVLETPPGLVEHLGIDEHRRGKARWILDPATGEYTVLADRWHTCFFDLSGEQGLLGQVQGRTADDACFWLAQASPAWRHHVKIVAIDMCSIYASAVRRMLPHARLVVDLFHVVQLATKMVGDVRRAAVRDKYGRRGRTGDSEYGIKNLLVRNLEHLRPDQFDQVMDRLGADRYGQRILAAWIAKEKLRDVLNLRARRTGSTPPERQVRDRLFAFYAWCADHADIPQLVTLANTVSRWEEEIIAAVLTGVTNARSEGLNRVAKLEARKAYGLRNPANQRRRVRTACTRRAASRTVTTRRSQTVITRQHDPG